MGAVGARLGASVGAAVTSCSWQKKPLGIGLLAYTLVCPPESKYSKPAWSEMKPEATWAQPEAEQKKPTPGATPETLSAT